MSTTRNHQQKRAKGGARIQMKATPQSEMKHTSRNENLSREEALKLFRRAKSYEERAYYAEAAGLLWCDIEGRYIPMKECALCKEIADSEGHPEPCSTVDFTTLLDYERDY